MNIQNLLNCVFRSKSVGIRCGQILIACSKCSCDNLTKYTYEDGIELDDQNSEIMINSIIKDKSFIFCSQCNDFIGYNSTKDNKESKLFLLK